MTAADHTLADLRRRAGLSQSQVAARMAIGQARISAIENSDLNTLTVATLAAYLNAVGAPLRLQAHPRDGEVVLRTADRPSSTAH